MLYAIGIWLSSYGKLRAAAREFLLPLDAAREQSVVTLSVNLIFSPIYPELVNLVFSGEFVENSSML